MKTDATHLSDDELLLAFEGDELAARDPGVSAHLRECSACQERFVRLDQLLDDVRLASADEMAPGWQHIGSRTRLARALSDAADDWQRSWWFRLRVAMGGARIWWMVPAVVASTAVTVTLMDRSTVVPPERAVADASALPLPVATLTPGAVTTITAGELCGGARPPRQVSEAVRAQVVRDYDMEAVPESAYELDALITPELGGSTDRRNLWPQRFDSPLWNARVKDELERLLPRLVCDGRVDLARAQHEIAADWVSAYKKYFATDRPLLAHLTGVPPPDDDDLQIVTDEPAVARVTLRPVVVDPRLVLIARTP